MSETGEKFFSYKPSEERYDGRKVVYAFDYQYDADAGAVVGEWDRLAQLHDYNAALALTHLVDSLTTDEYIGLVKELESEVNHWDQQVPSILQPNLSLAYVHDGTVIAPIGDRRSLHRSIHRYADSWGEVLHNMGLTQPIKPEPFAVDALGAPAQKEYYDIDSHLQESAAKSGIYIFDEHDLVDTTALMNVYCQAVDAVPDTGLVPLAQFVDHIADRFDAVEDSPLYRQNLWPHGYYCELTNSDVSGVIYRKVANRHDLKTAIAEYFEGGHPKQELIEEEFIRLFGFEDELFWVHDEELTPQEVLERRKLKEHPQLPLQL